VIGVLAGGLTAVALGVLSGLAAPGTDPAGLAALAVQWSVLVSGASLVALVCAFATAARRIRELEP
jgi:ABC-type antimicrobial peptide transport system permease subunit